MPTVRSADGTAIAYEHSGAGPALVLVGGAFQDRSAAAGLAERLSGRFTVYRYDRRGRGGSGDRAPYAPEREVEDLGALLAVAGGSVGVFGHSSGAVLALEAACAGLPVRRLACYEPPYLVGDAQPSVPAGLEARLERALRGGRPEEAARLFLRRAMGLPPRLLARAEASPSWPGMVALAHTLPYELALCGPDRSLPADRLSGIDLPVLVLDGERSPTWAREAVAALAEALPRSRSRTLPDQGHNPEPAVLAPVLADFFS